MSRKYHLSSALLGLAVFGGAFLMALSWFADESTGAGIGIVAMNLFGVSTELKVPVFIVVVLMAALTGTIAIFRSREKVLTQRLCVSGFFRKLAALWSDDHFSE